MPSAKCQVPGAKCQVPRSTNATDGNGQSKFDKTIKSTEKKNLYEPCILGKIEKNKGVERFRAFFTFLREKTNEEKTKIHTYR